MLLFIISVKKNDAAKPRRERDGVKEWKKMWETMIRQMETDDYEREVWVSLCIVNKIERNVLNVLYMCN